MSVWPKKGILGILQRQLEIYMNEKSAGRNAKQKPMRRRGTPLTSNKRRGTGDLFFTARIGRTKNPGALRNRKKVLGSPFPGGCNKFSLDVGVRRRRSARPSKEHEFCAAYSLPVAAPRLSRESRSKEPESAQYGSSGRKFPCREVVVERQRVSGSLESGGSGLTTLVSRRAA